MGPLPYILSFVPLALFVVALLVMDSFSLTKWRLIIATFLAGMACCAVSFTLLEYWESPLGDAVIEEGVKGLVFLFLIGRRKAALLGDTTIYGACVGAGFGLLENILHLASGTAYVDAWEAISMGLEAAVMHIGCTSTLAMMLIMAWQGKFGQLRWNKGIAIAISFVLAILIHYLHNLAHHYIPPLIVTVVLIIYFIISKYSLFKKNERFIHAWIDDCLNNEVALLSAIRKGELSTTHAGEYLLNLKESLDPLVFFDMCCYMASYLELSIAAKSNLLLRQAGMPPLPVKDNRAKIAELKALRKRIGRSGIIALAPIVSNRDIDRWIVENK